MVISINLISKSGCPNLHALKINKHNKQYSEITTPASGKYGDFFRERSGSVVECLTRDRGAAGSSLTGVTALWPLSKTQLS